MVDDVEEIKVKLSDGREFKARLIGRDSKTDLALIKISSLFKDLPVLELGDSDRMRVGDWVVAVGNPFRLEHTVTQGIISATGSVIVKPSGTWQTSKQPLAKSARENRSLCC